MATRNCIVCVWLADLQIRSTAPWSELARFGRGLIQPDFATFDTAIVALTRTLAFAFTGVGAAAVLGMGLALIFHYRVVRIFCAFVRSIMNCFGHLFFCSFLVFTPSLAF